MNPRRFDRPRRRERLRRAWRGCRSFAKIEDDAKRVLEAVSVADDIGSSELDAKVVAGERCFRDVGIFVRLLDVRRFDGTLESHHVRARLFDDGVLRGRGERENQLRDSLHVGDGDLNSDRGRLRGMNLQYARGRIPRRIEPGRAQQEALEKLPGNERTIVDRHRRNGHLDQIVFDDGETAVGPERGHGVVERGLEAIPFVNQGPAERGEHFIGGKVCLAVLLRDSDFVIAVRCAHGGLIGRVHRRRRWRRLRE